MSRILRCSVIAVAATVALQSLAHSGGRIPEAPSIAAGQENLVGRHTSVAPKNSKAIPPQASPGGKTYGEWAAAYFQWAAGIPLSEGFSDDGTHFSLDQSGQVWFVQPGCSDRNYVLPAGKMLWAPIFFGWNEYPCPDPAFHPAPGQSMEDFLLSGLTPAIDANPPVDGALVVDGVPLTQLETYRGTSKLFEVTFDPSWGAIDGCVTSGPQPCVTDGYWVMLKPFSVGSHTLNYPGCDTIHLTVVHDGTVATAPQGVTPASATSTAATSWGRLKVIYR